MSEHLPRVGIALWSKLGTEAPVRIKALRELLDRSGLLDGDPPKVGR
jgi:hypothetical protein